VVVVMVVVEEPWLELDVVCSKDDVDAVGRAGEERKTAGGRDDNPAPACVGVGVRLERRFEYTAGTETECECARGTGDGGCLGDDEL
jgi:hypothetical protein